MSNFDEILKTMPVGLKKAVGRQISYHIGAANMIDRTELLRILREEMGLEATTDRQMRLAIQYYRTLGVRICHIERHVKEPGRPMRVEFGYYLAMCEAEYQEFRIKYKKYANTINLEVQAMDRQEAVIVEDGEVEVPEEGSFQPAFGFAS